MLSIVLSILKILGIILLSLLLVILLLAIILLFVPIRYYGNGFIEDDKKQANVQVTWLLKMVRFKLDYSYPKKPILSLKVLFLDIFKIIEKRKSKNTGKKKPKKLSQKSDAKEVAGVNQPEMESEHETERSEISKEETDAQQYKDENNQNEFKSTNETVDNNKLTIKNKIEKIIFKIKSLCDKIRNIKDNIDYYLEIWNEEETLLFLKDAWKSIEKILKSIRPKIFHLEGEFGFETPDTTGKVYGYYCMISPLFSEYINLTPNFEEKILKGHLKFKGRITIFVLLINGLRILFDKRLQPLIKKLKHGG